MKISLDFDGTITADPVFWCAFIMDAKDRGHDVITVTHRRDTPENRRAIENILGPSHLVIFAYDRPKKLAAIEAGHQVDIWIDDAPHGIGTGDENLETQSVFEIELRNALAVLKDALPFYWESHPKLLDLCRRLGTVL